jgi:hypothetical protein
LKPGPDLCSLKYPGFLIHNCSERASWKAGLN